MKHILLLAFLLPAMGFAQDAAPAFPNSTLLFVGSSVKLNKAAKDSLALIARRIKDNPASKVVVRGYCSASKKSVQLSWDRVNTVINHLIEKEGISYERMIFKYGEEGDCNTVDIVRAAPDEEGPHTVPAPHPNLRRRG